MYVNLLNVERVSTLKLLEREFRYDLTMEKRCKELIALNNSRLIKILGENYDRIMPEQSDSLKTDSDFDSSVASYSDMDDLISMSQRSKGSATKPP